MAQEEWRAVPGYEGAYEVSSLGRVRSLPRRKTSGRILQARCPSSRYPMVGLSVNKKRRNFRVHRLVALAFLGSPPEDKPQVLHRNDDPKDNRIENLYYGTTQQNRIDSVTNGRHHQARKTHCHRGHEFTEENTRYSNDGRHRALQGVRENPRPEVPEEESGGRMIHPANLVDWEAEAHCDTCEGDTDHYFAAPYGRGTVTYLTCEVCGRETELSPEDFED